MTIANFNPAGGHAKTLPSSIILKNKVAPTLTILMLSVLSLNTAHAALTATTAQTIQGTAPYLILSDGTILTDLAQLQGFSMPSRDGSASREQIDANMAGTSIAAPIGMKFQDVTLLVLADGSQHAIPNSVGDKDGDANIASSTSVTGTMKATWYNGSIPITNLNQILNSCDIGPYTLEIEIPTSVSANTQYGDPNSNLYGTASTVTYTFIAAENRICHIQPQDLTVYSGQYNSRYWDIGKGFNVDNLKSDNIAFPATGFPYAVLQIIGAGNNQTQYECRKTGANWATLSTGVGAGTNCTLTYNPTSGNKPTGMMTIELGKKVGGVWIKLDDYTIPAPKLWAEAGDANKIPLPLPTGFITNNNITWYNSVNDFSGRYLAAESCYTGVGVSPVIAGVTNRATAASNFFSKNQLTNGASGVYLTRTADSSFMGEWGVLQNYSGSPWSTSSYYWTSDSFSVYQYIVEAFGSTRPHWINSSSSILPSGAICKRN